MKNSVIGLLALSTIGLMSVPALADEANVQTSEQVTTQIGDRNSSTQRTSQSNYSNRRGRSENVGNAQDSFQDSLQEGNDNRSEQTVNQRNSSRRSRR
ncbi:hypothetical protein [Myxosarcina sp. GI1]|uniref:hypothetical protein n=1 Tax=Myxosarcina sp. GI1 TaxID=1541065 RepID=UPI000564D71A|nr:hypothetical protein [Myxosarcina sp. GI1]